MTCSLLQPDQAQQLLQSLSKGVHARVLLPGTVHDYLPASVLSPGKKSEEETCCVFFIARCFMLLRDQMTAFMCEEQGML